VAERARQRQRRSGQEEQRRSQEAPQVRPPRRLVEAKHLPKPAGVLAGSASQPLRHTAVAGASTGSVCAGRIRPVLADGGSAGWRSRTRWHLLGDRNALPIDVLVVPGFARQHGSRPGRCERRAKTKPNCRSNDANDNPPPKRHCLPLDLDSRAPTQQRITGRTLGTSTNRR
jgi:hypothetical protein